MLFRFRLHGGQLIATNELRFVILLAGSWFAPAVAQQQPLEQNLLEKERLQDAERPLQLKASGGAMHDSNPFRLSSDADAASALGSTSKSDNIYRLGAAGLYEFRHSRQKVIAEASLDQYWYRNFSDLNNTSYNLRGEWLWEAGNRWDGSLGFLHRRYLEAFSNIQANIKDMIEQDRAYGSANYRFHPRVKVTVDLNWTDSDHGAESRQTLDSEIRNAAFTLNWVTPAENTVGLQYRHADARYPNSEFVAGSLVDNAYTEDEVSLVSRWRMTGTSTLVARVGHTERKFDQLPNRNFSGPTWRVTYQWRPAGKAGLDASAWQEISEFEDLSANYVRSTGASVSPTWSLTQQVSLRGRVLYQIRDYLGDPGVVAITERREDEETLLQLAAIWTPYRQTDVTFALDAGKRTSNEALADYEYQAVSATLTRRF
jgi:exopolysaccharide biosynthesis operon protein EpsL